MSTGGRLSTHPLLDELGSLTRAVEHERLVMAPVRSRADYIINTTTLPVRTRSFSSSSWAVGLWNT